MPTNTPLPTPTATPIPAPLYLPVALSEAPCTRTQRADIVLVIDASTSMNEPAGDQAAVVGFNRDARLLVGLTDDPAELTEALDRLDTASETCSICGLEAVVAIASRPAFAHRASDGAALEAIYREIAVTLPRPADCYWGRRP